LARPGLGQWIADNLETVLLGSKVEQFRSTPRCREERLIKLQLIQAEHVCENEEMVGYAEFKS
jgi:hypothetical protein